MWWHTPLTSELRQQRQADFYEFKLSLVYLAGVRTTTLSHVPKRKREIWRKIDGSNQVEQNKPDSDKSLSLMWKLDLKLYIGRGYKDDKIKIRFKGSGKQKNTG